MSDLTRDLDAYAELAAALADPTADRAALLAAHALDEEAWEAIDDRWQTLVSQADVTDPDGEGVPAFVSAYAEAFARAQRARSGGVIPFERFIEAAREMKRGIDMATVLKRLGLRLEDFLNAQRHWTARMLEDEALATRFQRALR